MLDDRNQIPLKSKTVETAEFLSSRAERYREEIERVVTSIGEHPQFELKRACDLSNLRQRMEFVKDIQSIATSQIDSEKFLIIGVDETNREFVPVTNAQDFDEAKVRQQLEKYLTPVPKFEIFSLKASTGALFILVVLSRQPTRRIIARVTVSDPSDQKPNLLLREGDLWTKGDSTGKRLAKPEDWDAIYEDAVEREAESRTRARTDHLVQEVVTQERLRITSGSSFAIPAHLSDQDLKLMTEDICARGDSGRLSVLLEHFRDELVEGWHKLNVFDNDAYRSNLDSVPKFREDVRSYRDDIFRPAMQRLILLGLCIVKNKGALHLFEQLVELLQEIYNASHQMYALRFTTERGSKSDDPEQHLSHTFVALESLVAIYVVGAYVVRRRRFTYISPLLTPLVFKAGLETDPGMVKYPLAMWPLHPIWGEPATLKFRAGKIDLCVSKIMRDSTISAFFGSEDVSREAIIQFEFMVEFNSFLGVKTADSPKTVEFLHENYPAVDFNFWPSLIAFEPRYFQNFAAEIISWIKSGSEDSLSKILFDARTAGKLGSSGVEVFVKFLRGLIEDHQKLMFQLNRFPGYFYWPQIIQDAFDAYPRR